jgi:excisionase family DNA binding protein
MPAAEGQPSARLLTEPEAAVYLGTTARHMRTLRYNRRMPYVKLGGKVRFDRLDLDRFIKTHKIGTERC